MQSLPLLPRYELPPKIPTNNLSTCDRPRVAKEDRGHCCEQGAFTVRSCPEALRDQLELASRPVQPDPTLIRLRHDLEMSVQQAALRATDRDTGHRLGLDQ